MTEAVTATARVVAVQDGLVEIEALPSADGSPGRLVKNEVVYILPRRQAEDGRPERLKAEVPRVKGTHNAMLSGAEAAQHIATALAAGRAHDTLAGYENGWRDGPVGRDLYPVRNAKPLWSKYGTMLGMAAGGFDMWTNALFGVSLFGTVGHGGADHEALKPAHKARPIRYPKPDGEIVFDRPSSVYLSNTNHAENQPVHLKVKNPDLQRASELGTYEGPSSCYCPAGVYEWDLSGDMPRFVINAQNCVHCKTCDIKDPNQNITWVPPEGGGGPNYQGM